MRDSWIYRTQMTLIGFRFTFERNPNNNKKIVRMWHKVKINAALKTNQQMSTLDN